MHGTLEVCKSVGCPTGIEWAPHDHPMGAPLGCSMEVVMEVLPWCLGASHGGPSPLSCPVVWGA